MRAIRAGELLFVSGTTASGLDGRPVAEGTYAQTEEALRRVTDALAQLGAPREAIVRSRLFPAPAPPPPAGAVPEFESDVKEQHAD